MVLRAAGPAVLRTMVLRRKGQKHFTVQYRTVSIVPAGAARATCMRSAFVASKLSLHLHRERPLCLLAGTASMRYADCAQPPAELSSRRKRVRSVAGGGQNQETAMRRRTGIRVRTELLRQIA
jgi:hypothetical protein